MGMFDQVRAVPKPEKKQKLEPYEKKRPKPTKKKKPKKKSELKAERDGLKVPSASKRNSFTEAEYEKAVQKFGKMCNDPTCSLPASDMHHIVFRSQSGRGKWRNAVPLCMAHHEKCHRNRKYADMWRLDRTVKFGERFYHDEWDLWMDGLITEPTKEAYEIYMEGEEKSERKVGGSKIHGY